ncbi:MAG: SAM-dependent methyltransferase [Prevotella sp.]|nr:SAM-dependent methyltransferase [Prevotella sp.]
MDIQHRLNDEATQAFVADHRADDVRLLAFMADKHPDVDMSWALQQIAGWQMARRKLPSWAAVEGMVYPPHLSMEQCSSEQTAKMKTTFPSSTDDGLLIDLTGGFGVDFSFMAQYFKRAVYVERQEDLCAIARHNFHLLGLHQAEVVCGDGVEYLHQMQEHASVIYLDPARRNEHGGKTYAISDCTPDVVALREELLKKADFIVVKLSPMLDWREAVRQLPAQYTEVRIVSTGGECKELLLILSDKMKVPLRLVCINDEELFSIDNLQLTIYNFGPQQENVNSSSGKRPCGPSGQLLIVNDYLYEPNASIMKAGCFAELCERFGVKAIAENSHLFVSPDFIENFPGRKFQIFSISTMNKKSLRQTLQGIDRANISVRNFLLSADQLRQRLHLKDGGDTYIFGTTTCEGDHILLVCKKIK